MKELLSRSATIVMSVQVSAKTTKDLDSASESMSRKPIAVKNDYLELFEVS